MNGKKIVDMMEIAFQAGRTVPSIVFETPDGSVKLYRQTDRSRSPGSISMNDGGPKGSDVWYGSIDKATGHVMFRRECPQAARAIVSEFAKDPGAYAAAYGQGTKRCCFCATKITTDESKAVGYGPTCAGNYGLPWGSKKAPTLKDWVEDPGKVVRESKTGPHPGVMIGDEMGFGPVDDEGAPLNVDGSPSDDFEDSLTGDPGNDAEAALAAMEGAAGYADADQELDAYERAGAGTDYDETDRPFKPTPAESLADAILKAAEEGGREAAIEMAQTWIDIHKQGGVA